MASSGRRRRRYGRRTRGCLMMKREKPKSVRERPMIQLPADWRLSHPDALSPRIPRRKGLVVVQLDGEKIKEGKGKKKKTRKGF